MRWALRASSRSCSNGAASSATAKGCEPWPDTGPKSRESVCSGVKASAYLAGAGDLPKRPFIAFRRLGSFDSVRAVHHDEGHTAHAPLHPGALALPHFGLELVALQDRLRALPKI